MAIDDNDQVFSRFDLDDEPSISLLWGLRVLQHCGVNNRLLKRFDNHFEGIYRLLVREGGSPPKQVPELRQLIDTRLAHYENLRPEMPAVLARNLQWIGERVGLTATERQVLALRSLYRVCDVWESVVDAVTTNAVTDQQIVQIIATALRLPREEIASALRPEGTLQRVGLLELNRHVGPFQQRLKILAGLPTTLLRDCASGDELLSFAAKPAAAATLRLAAYPHLMDETTLLQDYLSALPQGGQPGVNILLHGAPGTGKSELVRAIAEALGWRLYEVNSEAEAWHNSAETVQRFQHYCFLQQLLSSTSRTLIVFDEVEDIFPRPSLVESKRVVAKAEINRVLESNPVPAFWVSNYVGHLDPAFLRRFDLIIEVNSPPRSVRRRLLEEALGSSAANHPAFDRIASIRNLTPAVLTRAAHVVRRASPEVGGAVERLDLVLKGYEDLVSHAGDTGHLQLPRHYDLAFVNATEALESVCQALMQRGRGRVLLHGPPGTGKTAFANYVAQTLDRPLLLRRAADIFTPWLGESERNARKMFEEAGHESAVLFLDEADSVLRDRAGAIGRWEGPIVTEILTGMERFQGVFLCATNLLESLDVASLRRFTFKIGFRWLTGEQRWRLLRETFPDLAVAATADESARAQVALSQLDALTPGDFAVVAERQASGIALESLLGAVAALAVEQQYKPTARRAIGF